MLPAEGREENLALYVYRHIQATELPNFSFMIVPRKKKKKKASLYHTVIENSLVAAF